MLFSRARIASRSLFGSLRHQLLARRDFTIAIDGPAASGKSSTARAVAQELGLGYIDSGSIYRCATLLALRNNIDINESAGDLAALINKATVDIRVRPSTSHPAPNLGRLAVPEVQVLLDNEDVSKEIRAPEVNQLVAKVASDRSIREAVLHIQRQLVENAESISTNALSKNAEGVPGGVVMDGRDIGTTIFPNAELKIYLDASAMARAIRRWDEMNNQMKEANALQAAKGSSDSGSAPAAYPSVEKIARELEARDYADINREHSPLRIAKDAVVIDNTNLTFEQQVYTITDLARERMGLAPKHGDL
ncbi:Cytidylate kinase-domain-containing protein [Kickxella alabastrina]|uniref:Cytidylate kinase-domain-containing protein n=1 Tax=Kickxella alabastrina TaxID=61397 RepID=UPI0022210D30|nr:Cytidylate kinase-domain-containing protein [Kickxella alabastrina]KAI7833555.1 Cytidylate kinase-domain-containing protein [Kickxella alabastrina]